MTENFVKKGAANKKTKERNLAYLRKLTFFEGVMALTEEGMNIMAHLSDRYTG